MNKYIENKYITLDPGLKTAIEKINDNYIKKSELNELLRKITVTADNKDIVIKVGIPQVDEAGEVTGDYKEIVIDLNKIWDERKIKEVVGADVDGFPNVPEDKRSENCIYLTPISGDLNSIEDPNNKYIEWTWKKDTGTWDRLGSQTMTTLDVEQTLYGSDYNPDTPTPTSVNFIVLSEGQYDPNTHKPLITDPQEGVIYLVQDVSDSTDNIYKEWIYINGRWDELGAPSMTVDELMNLIEDI